MGNYQKFTQNHWRWLPVEFCLALNPMENEESGKCHKGKEKANFEDEQRQWHSDSMGTEGSGTGFEHFNATGIRHFEFKFI
jgi:hypothetical protein